MKRSGGRVVAWLVAIVCLGGFAGCDTRPAEQIPATAPPLGVPEGTPAELPGYRRIVSLSPSITEILFAIGAGDRVLGVTKFCDYPPEARTRQVVGGYLDTNYEMIISLRPDLVILPVEHTEALKNLSLLGIQTYTVDHRNIEGIIQSIRFIGGICHAEDAAEEYVRTIEGEIRAIRDRLAGEPRPSVLVVIQRDYDTGRFDEVIAAGNDGFYSALLEMAGGRNAWTAPGTPFPILGMESLMRLDPDLVIDIVPPFGDHPRNRETLRAQWNILGELRAVRTGRVAVFTDDVMVRPGPRFVTILRQMARVIHPEALDEANEPPGP